jgi:hypothetical protein
MFAALEHVHGHVGLTAILELKGGVADFCDFFGRQQA